MNGKVENSKLLDIAAPGSVPFMIGVQIKLLHPR